jgi:hypothetical protein
MPGAGCKNKASSKLAVAVALSFSRRETLCPNAEYLIGVV